jgi:hypothetical protein
MYQIHTSRQVPRSCCQTCSQLVSPPVTLFNIQSTSKSPGHGIHSYYQLASPPVITCTLKPTGQSPGHNKHPTANWPVPRSCTAPNTTKQVPRSCTKLHHPSASPPVTAPIQPKPQSPRSLRSQSTSPSPPVMPCKRSLNMTSHV